MKKGLKTKLGLSVASLALVAGALSTTTYAWFTTNATASVDQIETTAISNSASIYLSTDGSKFGKTVSIDASTVTLNAVTYDEASNSYKTLDGENPADGAILSFTIYFKTTVPSGAEGAGNIYFDLKDGATSFAVKGTPDEFTLLADATTNSTTDTNLVAGTGYQGYLTDATRLAVTDCGTITGATIGDVDEENKFSDGTRTTYTTSNGTSVELGGVDQVEKGAFPYYKNVMNPGDSFVNPFAGETAKTENTSTNAAAIAANTLVCAGVTSGKIGKVTFVYYIEGWDADAFDAVLGQTVQINLAFNLSTAE